MILLSRSFAMLLSQYVIGIAAQCSQATTTIASQADATGLSSCATFTGAIVIPKTASGPLNISGLGEIRGDLIVDNVGITSLTMPLLTNVTGTMTIANSTSLTTVDFPKLKNVVNLNFVALPGLTGAGLDPNVVMNTTNVKISNTSFSVIPNFGGQPTYIRIDNNKLLLNMSLDATDMGEISVHNNGAKLRVGLPNLLTIGNAVFINTTGIDVPVLTTIRNSMSVASNYFTLFSAPRLQSINNSVEFQNNSKMIDLSVPMLKSIGGDISIFMNSALQQISGFQSLEKVGSALAVSGNFSSMTFPSLKNVTFGVNIQTSRQFNCAALRDQWIPTGIVHDQFLCVSTNASVAASPPTVITSNSTSNSTGMSGSTGSQTGSGNSGDSTIISSGLSMGAKAGIGVGIGISVVILFAIGIYLCRKKGYSVSFIRHKREKPIIPSELGYEEKNQWSELPNSHARRELGTGIDHEKSELAVVEPPVELAASYGWGPVPGIHEIYTHNGKIRKERHKEQKYRMPRP
ncbi:hypothetical protein BGZ60DRAFT_429990 [Tricladium varicosporioides]|nr:hypothetical protein BGZ60DRAFT_429990 [Hymenoscyphus varicosporioides]